MLNRKARRAGVIAAALAVFAGMSSCAAAGSAVSAPGSAASAAAGPAWHVLKQVRSGSFGGFTVIVTAGRDGGWAFDGFSAPAAWEWSGSSWTRVPFPGLSGEEVIAAGAAGPRDVWAVTAGGNQSRALRWDGRAWAVQKMFPGQAAAAIVISPADVWVFGQLYQPGGGMGTWHYNGSTWSRVRSAQGLAGGSAVSASDIWAFGGTSVAHWNGRTWTWTSVARLLPPRQPLNFPTVKGILALSDTDVYAVGSGNAQDEGGPTVILRYDGHAWTKVAGGYYGVGTQPDQRVISDGHGGLWIPMPGVDLRPSYLLHYASGQLASIALPRPAIQVSIECVALIPGTSALLAAGMTHSASNPGASVIATIYQYGP